NITSNISKQPKIPCGCSGESTFFPATTTWPVKRSATVAFKINQKNYPKTQGSSMKKSYTISLSY
ncbi:hypothetical protein, partial [Enterococcus italicus]